MPKLPPLVEALLQPQAYPEEVHKVDLLQTHISYVFLAGDYVYKVKKPVNFGFLDFGTLEKRRFYCQEEVRLNQRLSPDMYLGIARITLEKGAFSIEGRGEVVEYAVKMRRLPQEQMLDGLLSRDEVSFETMRRIAEKIAEFHSRAETNDRIATFGQTKTVGLNIEENFNQVKRYTGVTIPKEKYEVIRKYALDFMDEEASLFAKRIRDKKIKDCHGDLHTASICVANRIYIFDCIEFNERFRYCDVASDLAFLAMDLEFHGRKDLSNYLVEVYLEKSADLDLPKLLPFYKCYRAYVRGKVGSLSLDDPHLPEGERQASLQRARKYFDLAYSYTFPEVKTLFITAGLIGTGKTTLGEGLARRMGLELISSDVVRKELAQRTPQEHRSEGFEEGIYSKEFSRYTYNEMFRRARGLLEKGESVILDASFQRQEDRKATIVLANETGADLKIIECVSTDYYVKERLGRRLEEGYSPSDGRWEIYLEQKKVFEPLTEVPDDAHIVLDTSGAKEEVLLRALEQLGKKDITQKRKLNV
ncbi:MAG: AAA family ATPase [Chloroflexi bacterium]|nr:AAA family ATPase [Chloroflexota bacterium]